jgi:hypothetical protein
MKGMTRIPAMRLNNGRRDSVSKRTVTHLDPRAGNWLVALMTCGFAAVLSASSSSSPVVSRLEKPARDTLASQIEAARVKLLNVKIESEGWIERRASLSDAWERTAIHVAATAWFDGRSKRARVDVHSEVLEWHEGAAPYYERCYTVAFDGTTGVFVDHAFGYNGEMFPRRWAEISREAPPLLRDGGWIGDFTGIAASAHFFSRSRSIDLKKLVLAANSPPSDPNGATIEAYRIQRSGTDEEVQIDVVGVKGTRVEYRLDPLRGFALLESKEMHVGKDGKEKVRFRTEVNKLQEVAPGVWYPVEAAFERPSSYPSLSGQPYERLVYRAWRVAANDPNWADTVFTVPIPQGYSVDDHVTGTEYRMGQAQKGTEKEKK